MGARDSLSIIFVSVFDQLNTTIETLLIALGVFLLVLLYRNHGRNPPEDSNFPSGPYGWKLFSLVPSLITHGIIKGYYFHELLIHWGKKYNGMYSFGTYPVRILVITDFETMKEAWKHPDLNDRAPDALRDHLFRGKGLLFSSGETWKEQRKFSLSVLRSFGVGKRSFENDIAEEAQYLTNKLRLINGKPFNPTLLFCNAVANVICSVTFGKRYDYEDDTFRLMLEYIEYILVNQIGVAILTDGFPFTVNMPFGPVARYRKCLIDYRQSIRRVIQEHRNTFDENNLRDFIDVYFQEMKLKKEQGQDTKLNEDNMESTVEDLFLAGSETTATTLRWCAVLMLEYPDVQSRVQQELDDIIGRNRLPTLADRPNLPYTEAVIQEIARFATIAPIGAPHFTTVETSFRGYRIPKDTMIIGNFWSISRDKKLWNDDTLDEFRPERFLDENCNTLVKKPEHHIVFGSGKRACIGEQLAKMEIYIFFTHMLHQFTMKKPPGAGSNDLRGSSGAVHGPFPFEICIVPRNMADD